MNKDKHNQSEPEDWDEFDWERNLRESDDYARRYFQLLDRFSDLPGAGELISAYLGRGENDDDCNFDCDNCEERWSCDLSMANEWNTANNIDMENEDFDFAGEDDDDSEEGNSDSTEPGSYYFYETDSRFKLLRQVALGWCNVYAAVLPQESRRTGLKILFHLGRALGNLSYSIGDGLYEYSEASVAFTKRSMEHLNAALGLLRKLMTEKPRLAPLLGAMRKHILKSRNVVFDHLKRCREQ